MELLYQFTNLEQIMYDDNHIGVCFLGSEGSQKLDVDNSAFQKWLYETIYRLVEAEYCTRFIFRAINDFEVACLKMILGQVLLDDKIIKKVRNLDGVDFLLIVADDGTVEQSQDIDSGKSRIDAILPRQLKYPLSITPYSVAGGQRDKICEMIDLSNHIVCCLPADGTADNRFYYEYVKAAGIDVSNWTEQSLTVTPG